jgi:uncharacterized protein
MFRYCTAAGFLALIGCSAFPDRPLNSAASAGDVAEIRRLVAAGANVNEPAAHGITPLVSAARAGAVNAIPVLIGLGADPNLRCGVNGWSPLMHAIHKHQLASARALLEGGADVNGRGDGSENALMMAAGYGYTDFVNMLLDHGANPRARTPKGMNALDLAVTGVMDIDRFTAGDCQDSTIKTLVERVPDLKLEGLSGIEKTVLLNKLRGCAILNKIVKR